MTVKELREFIKDFPDDMPVIALDAACKWAEAREGVLPMEMVNGEFEFRAPVKGTDSLVITG